MVQTRWTSVRVTWFYLNAVYYGCTILEGEFEKGGEGRTYVIMPSMPNSSVALNH